MIYQQLEQIQKEHNGNVCIFGTGLIGRTWGYDVLVAAGFTIDYYYDNKLKAGEEIIAGIRTVDFDTLCAQKQNTIVFVTVTEKYHEEIQKQLERAGIKNYFMLGYKFYQDICESIAEAKDKAVVERYKAIVDDEIFLKRQFYHKLGYELNLDKPRTFNEKLQWLKLNDCKPEYTKLVDKYEFKKHIENVLGAEYTIPTLGVWDKVEDIDWDMLPQQFVLKCTHDSGSIIICRNKNEFDKEKACEKLQSALKRNFYWVGREKSYKDIPPRIIAEKYMLDIAEDELKDYKIHCFDGRAVYIQVDYDRFIDHKRNIYTPQWEYIDMEFGFKTNKDIQVKRPEGLNEMLQTAEILSKDIPYVRVDLYYANGNIYVGEMTFYHGSGYEYFRPKTMDNIWGDNISLI